MRIHHDVISCSSKDGITEVAKIIRDKKLRHVYVVKDKKLIGIVGGIDINNKVIAQGLDYKELKAEDIMNSVECVAEGQKIEYAYAIMRNFNTFICPVVDKNRHLKGYLKFAEVCEEINDQINKAGAPGGC